MKIVRLAGVASIAFLSACGGPARDGLVVGGLYSVKQANEYWVTKVLALDNDVVHLRIYRNRYKDRPVSVDPSKLSVGSLKDKDSGMGHIPLNRKHFTSAWEPRFIMQTEVKEEELEGYNLWKGSGGGAFK